MAEQPIYIRQWREAKGFTLDALVGRLSELGFDTTVATLSRVERGKRPYSAPILNALADALDIELWRLFRDDPTIPEAKVIDFCSHLDAKELVQAETVLRAMFGDRT